MQEPLAAIDEVKAYLEEHALRYIVIGGIANAVWGRPRATCDANFKVMGMARSMAELVALIGARFAFRVSSPEAFARQTYVLPIFAAGQVPVDIGVGYLPYEQESIERGQTVELEGVRFAVCTAEDLIIHKAIFERPKDWEDIEGVLIRQGNALDQRYVLGWLAEFASALKRPTLLKRYTDLLDRLKPAGGT